MAIAVLFDVSACPADKSRTNLDFKALGQQTCVADLFKAISEVCGEDSTWINYNPQFTIEGGVFASDCGPCMDKHRGQIIEMRNRRASTSLGITRSAGRMATLSNFENAVMSCATSVSGF
jgi:hypothetical protein